VLQGLLGIWQENLKVEPSLAKVAALSIARRAERRVNITATLPLEFLEKIDELIELNTVPSRSFVIREAVERYLKEF